MVNPTTDDDLRKEIGMRLNPPTAPDVHFTVTIPGEMAHLRNDIRRFVDAMVFKLEKNAHKGRWEDRSLQDNFALLLKEIDELKLEIGGNTMKTVLEAADVANFAMIIASIAVERGK